MPRGQYTTTRQLNNTVGFLRKQNSICKHWIPFCPYLIVQKWTVLLIHDSVWIRVSEYFDLEVWDFNGILVDTPRMQICISGNRLYLIEYCSIQWSGVCNPNLLYGSVCIRCWIAHQFLESVYGHGHENCLIVCRNLLLFSHRVLA
jgi:hypothetical protein